MTNVLKAFTQHEAAEPFNPNLYQGSVLQANKHEIYPIAQVILDKSDGNLKQNPGY
jgi:hypothetical protein